MRIEQLEYVTAVTRLGSFRRAAEELHISQPALSETIRNLERELGVDILDRGRSGTTISDEGRELLPHMMSVLDAADRLRRSADTQHRVSRTVRVGTVNTATVPLVTPVIRTFHEAHPETQIEVVGTQQHEIHRGLLEGGFDLGLVNYLEGDDLPPGLETTELLRGRPVVCMRADDPLTTQAAVRRSDLLAAPLIGMRSGYAMHRYVHRLLRREQPSFSYSTDGAEMGKLLVAEGLGVTVLPSFSVKDDPLERSGVLTYRPIEDDDTDVLLVVQHRQSGASTRATRELRRLFVERGQALDELVTA